MATTEEKQARLEALEEALQTGVLTVEHDQKRITYRSLAAMRSVRDELRRELGVTTKGSRTMIVVTRG